jgi:hypothetical protein
MAQHVATQCNVLQRSATWSNPQAYRPEATGSTLSTNAQITAHLRRQTEHKILSTLSYKEAEQKKKHVGKKREPRRCSDNELTGKGTCVPL